MRKPAPAALSSVVSLALACSSTPLPQHDPTSPASPPPAAAPSKNARFTILQINDVYRIEGIEGGRRGGLARIRALRKQLEDEGRPVIVLHAGDLLFPSVMSKYLRAEPMVKTLNLLDGDAAARDGGLVIVFGNHEFDDEDPGLLLGRVAQSDFRWVSSNTRYRSTKDSAGEPFSRRLSNVHDTVVLDLNGLKVGILGLTTDMQTRSYVAYAYKQPAGERAVKEALGELKKGGAQVTIALTHQDLDDDLGLAWKFPEINLVVGGHEHLFTERKVRDTWITKADADAVTAVVHDVRVHDGQVETSHRKVDIGADIKSDPAVDAAVQGWLDALSKTIKEQTGKDPFEEVGSTEHLLEGVEPAVRGRETALGDFLADVVRDRMTADLAFINGGAIRINDNIPPGPVKRYDLEGIFYFDQHLVSFEITGAELLDVLRNSVAKVHAGSGRFLQVSSIKFQYHVGGPSERPTYRIDPADVRVRPRGAADYAPLDASRRYAVASLSYVWERGCQEGFTVFSKGCGGTSPKRLDTGARVGFRASAEEAISALPGHRITTAVEGRIIREPKVLSR